MKAKEVVKTDRLIIHQSLPLPMQIILSAGEEKSEVLIVPSAMS